MCVRVRPLVVTALLLLLACGGVARGEDPGRPRPERHVLGNGVVLIVQEQRASEVVALQLWMRVGGRDEAPDELGLSHYLEHMLFKGTPTRPPGSIDRMVEGVGGQDNAFTSYDFTHFDLLLPAGQAVAGIALLADIAVNASFDQAELDPDRFLARRLSEEAYRPTSYGRPILGTPEQIRALTREQLARYYHKHYVPKNMSLVVVGAVDPGLIRRAADDAFGRLRGPDSPRAPMPPPPDLGWRSCRRSRPAMSRGSVEAS